MGMRIKRKVVEYQKYSVNAKYKPATMQRETLECGHVVLKNGSIGKAIFRFCAECEAQRSII